MKKHFLITLLSFLFVAKAIGQDKIYRQNGKVVEAKVLEISSSEVKYKDYKTPDGPIYILETDRIKKIVFENGSIQTFEDNLKDPERYIGQRRKALKINFFSPLYSYSEIGFEQSTGFGKGYEFSLGIIGAGKSGTLDYVTDQLREVKRNPTGVFITAGYKFGKLPDFLIFGKTRATHLMQGTYVKPVLYFGNYSEQMITYKSYSNYEVVRQNVTFGALQLELGKQRVLAEVLVLDYYVGLGFGADNKKNSYNDYNTNDNVSYSSFNYSNSRAGKSPGFSVTFGVKLGLLLK